MKADWNDAPEYITRHPRKNRTLAKLIPVLIGTLVTLAVLQMAGSAFRKGTAQNIADKRIQPKPTPVAEITREDPVAAKDWDRVVEKVAAKDAAPRPQSISPKTSTVEITPTKQTVFSDANYMPRGADNVVSFKEPAQPVDLPKQAAKKEITVVGQKPSMKDRACWPHREGSVERRNCRSRIGLSYRD